MNELAIRKEKVKKTQENLEKIILALERSARALGQEEDEEIVRLEQDRNIIITKEKLLFQNQYIWIMVMKPYTEEDFELVKQQLDFPNFSHLADKYIIKCQLDGIEYIKYPERIEVRKVHDNLFDDLINSTRICKSLTEAEWEIITGTVQWQMAEIQIARELIANNNFPIRC